MVENTEKLNFLDKEIREKLFQEIEEGFYFRPEELKKWHQTRMALENFLNETKNLNEENPTVYNECLNLLEKLKWFSFNYLPNSEFVDLFKSHLSFALGEKTYPLENNLSIFLLSITWIPDRAETKNKIKENILINDEEITSQKLIINGKQESPTIFNWLKLYNQELGGGQINQLKSAEFFMKNSEIIKLTEEEKEKIKRLFNLYEELKIPADEMEGLEEEEYIATDQGIELQRRGRIVEIIKPAVSLKQSFVSEVEQFKNFDDEIEKLKKQQVAAVPIDINQAVETAITKVGLTFPDEILEKRFKNVIFSYLREVRGEIETRIVLKRPQKIGGVELDETTVDKVMDILKQEKPMIKVEPMGNIPQIELAEGLKQPEETISKFTRMEKPVEKIIPEIKPISPLPKIEEEKLLPQPEESKEKLLKEKFEQEPPAVSILARTQTYTNKDTDLHGQEEIQTKETQPVMPEFKPIIPLVLEKKIEEKPDEKKEPNLFTTVSEKPKTDVVSESLVKEVISGPEEITDVLKELDQLPEKDTPFVLDEDAEDKFKLPIKELPKEEPKPTETQTYADRDTDLRGQRETRIYLDKKTPPVLEKKIEEIKKEINPQPQAEIFIHRPPREPAMAKMEEIKVTPRVSGPIEELQGITLQDWRRWGNSEQAVQKIKEKIDLLGEESLVKKSEGIKAWKESEINKLYLDIGTESIDKGISVSEVIALRQKENRKTLNEEEFDKVVELNQNLRF